MPPQGIDMQAIQEALHRRIQSNQGTPAVSQMTSPLGQLPTGGVNTPTTPPPAPPAMPGVPSGLNTNLPPRDQTNSLMKTAQATQGPGFDDQTRAISKVLVKKLLDVL
jgi:hypothetical protein